MATREEILALDVPYGKLPDEHKKAFPSRGAYDKARTQFKKTPEARKEAADKETARRRAGRQKKVSDNETAASDYIRDNIEVHGDRHVRIETTASDKPQEIWQGPANQVRDILRRIGELDVAVVTPGAPAKVAVPGSTPPQVQPAGVYASDTPVDPTSPNATRDPRTGIAGLTASRPMSVRHRLRRVAGEFNPDSPSGGYRLAEDTGVGERRAEEDARRRTTSTFPEQGATGAPVPVTGSAGEEGQREALADYRAAKEAETAPGDISLNDPYLNALQKFGTAARPGTRDAIRDVVRDYIRQNSGSAVRVLADAGSRIAAEKSAIAAAAKRVATTGRAPTEISNPSIPGVTADVPPSRQERERLAEEAARNNEEKIGQTWSDRVYVSQQAGETPVFEKTKKPIPKIFPRVPGGIKEDGEIKQDGEEGSAKETDPLQAAADAAENVRRARAQAPEVRSASDVLGSPEDLDKASSNVGQTSVPDAEEPEEEEPELTGDLTQVGDANERLETRSLAPGADPFEDDPEDVEYALSRVSRPPGSPRDFGTKGLETVRPRGEGEVPRGPTDDTAAKAKRGGDALAVITAQGTVEEVDPNQLRAVTPSAASSSEWEGVVGAMKQRSKEERRKAAKMGTTPVERRRELEASKPGPSDPAVVNVSYPHEPVEPGEYIGISDELGRTVPRPDTAKKTPLAVPANPYKGGPSAVESRKQAAADKAAVAARQAARTQEDAARQTQQDPAVPTRAQTSGNEFATREEAIASGWGPNFKIERPENLGPTVGELPAATPKKAAGAVAPVKPVRVRPGRAVGGLSADQPGTEGVPSSGRLTVSPEVTTEPGITGRPADQGSGPNTPVVGRSRQDRRGRVTSAQNPVAGATRKGGRLDTAALRDAMRVHGQTNSQTPSLVDVAQALATPRIRPGATPRVPDLPIPRDKSGKVMTVPNPALGEITSTPLPDPVDVERSTTSHVVKDEDGNFTVVQRQGPPRRVAPAEAPSRMGSSGTANLSLRAAAAANTALLATQQAHEAVMGEHKAEFEASGRARTEVSPERREQIRAEVADVASKYKG